MKHSNLFRRGAALLLSLALVLTVLAGCSNNEGSSSTASQESGVSSVSETSQVSSAVEESSDVSSHVATEETSDQAEAKEITFQVVHADGTTKDFTINTTADNLREALESEGLIAGEESSYGLFVKTVDGETVDDANQEWWCLTKGGQMWNYGVDDTEISDGDAFEFTFTVGY